MKDRFFDKNMSFYLIAAFLNAFVDLAHKITIQNVIFKTMEGKELLIYTQIVNALILLPFILLFTYAGELNDKRSKLANMRVLALAAVALTALITLFYSMGMFWAAFAATLALGAQAALYSPAKYGYAKELAKGGELAKANSAIQSVTIVSILLSTVLFSLVFESLTASLAGANKDEYLQNLTPIGVIMTVLSVMEYVFLLKIDKSAKCPQHSSDTSLSVMQKSKEALKDKSLLAATTLLALFYALSQSVMASFPSFAKESLGVESALAVQAAMGISALGVIAGSIVAGSHKNSRRRVSLAFFGMMGYALFLGGVLSGEIYLSFFFVGVSAGFIIVPLNTLIQERAFIGSLGSLLSFSNLAQNSLMTLFLALGVLAALFGVEAKIILIVCSLLALIGGIYALFYYPRTVIEAFLAILFSFKYRLTVRGKLPAAGKGRLLLGNHVSYIDWAFVQSALEERVYFLIEKEIYEKPLFRPFLSFFGCMPIDSKNAKESIKTAIALLKEGKTVAIFPEGELTKDSSVGEFKRGFELIAAKSGAKVYPFYLGGLFGSRFSKSPQKTFGIRKVELVFGEALQEISPKSAKEAVLGLRANSL